MRRWTHTIMLLLLVLSVCCSCSNNTDKAPNEQEAVQEVAAETWDSNEYLNYTYKEESLDNMLKILDENPLKAEAEYLGSYVKFTGYETLSTHSSNNELTNLGTSFLVQETLSSDYIFCEVPVTAPEVWGNKEKVTIWGKVITVGEVTDEPSYKVEVLHYEFEEPLPVEEIVYTEYTANDLINAYQSDRLKAERELYNAYVSITSPVHDIETDYFRFFKSSGNTATHNYGWIECPLTSDEQKAVIAEKDLGDTVTVKGRITGITYTLGNGYYKVEILEVE